MRLEQSFTLPYPRATVWPAFADVPMLVACMPGAGMLGEPRPVEGGADLELIFTVKLGPITGAFQGQGAIRRDDAACAGTFSGSGADRKSNSRVKGEAKFSLVELASAETRVDVAVDYSLTGSLAQFSRGAIVNELAAAMTRDFAANLQARIAASHPVDQPAHEPVDAPAPPGQALEVPVAPNAPPPSKQAAHPPQTAQPLDAGRLFWRVLWDRILSLFGRASR